MTGTPPLIADDPAVSKEEFRAQFYRDAGKIVRSPAIVSTGLQVSDAAFEAMQKDPVYREQMLELIARDWGTGTYPNAVHVVIQIGETAEDYRAHSWSASSDSRITTRTADDRKRSSSKAYWEKQKEFQARRRAEYRAKQAAMEAGARKYAAESALRQHHPDAAASKALLSYEAHSTTAVFEGFSLWDGGMMQV